MKVSELMSRPAVTVRPGSRLKEVAEILRSRQISSVPVVDGDRRLVGLVSEADLLALEVITDQRLQATPAALPAVAPSTAAEVMTKDVVAFEVDTDAGEAAGIMNAHRLRHVPVVEGGRVVGMLSRRDLIGMFSRADREIESEVRALLASELGRLAPRVQVKDGHLYIGLAREAPVYRLVESLATSVPGIVAVSQVPFWK